MLEGVTDQQLSLEAVKPTVRPGARTTLRGKVPATLTSQVWIFKKSHGNWKSFKRASLNGSTFSAKVKIHGAQPLQGPCRRRPRLEGRRRHRPRQGQALAAPEHSAAAGSHLGEQRPDEHLAQRPDRARRLQLEPVEVVAAVDADPRPCECRGAWNRGGNAAPVT